jgi:hypothetical protein
MGSSGGSSGGGTQTQNTKTELPAWESPAAREYLASVSQLIYGPGTTVPSNYITQKGYNFGSGSGAQGGNNPAASGGASMPANNSAGGAAQAPQTPGTQGLNPQLAQAFVQPMAGNSAYLQGQAAQNPSYLANMSSPSAFNQLAQLYPALMGTPQGGSS